MKVLVLTYWSFKEPLIQAATLPYLKMIRNAQGGNGKIWLLCLEKPQLKLSAEELAKQKTSLHALGIELILRPYYPFGFKAILSWIGTLMRLVRLCRSEEIDVLHAFGSPAGSAAHLLHRWLRIPYVVDSYEPHAESMVENGSWHKRSWAFRILMHFERKITRSAKAVVATTDAMKQYSADTYGQIPGNFLVKPACVDLEQFNPDNIEGDLRRDLNLLDKIVCIYAGKIGGIYLKKEIFDFFVSCREYWGERFHVVLLSDSNPKVVTNLARASGFPMQEVTLRYAEHYQVPAYMELADFALNPVVPVPSKRYCTSIKDGEYWAMGLPVVIPANISDDSDLIRQHHLGAVLETLEPSAYQSAVHVIDHLLKENRTALRQRIRKAAMDYRSYKLAQEVYRSLYAPGGILSLPTKHFLALIYNSFGDPLYANLMHRYLKRQMERNPNYQLDLITFEQKQYAFEPQEERTTRVKLSGQRIYWHPLTYHSGEFMLFKKTIDFTAAFFKVIRISMRHKPSMFLAFANTSAAISVILSKLVGSKLLIYSYEPHSDFLADFGIWKRSGWRYRLLNYLENQAGKHANYVLTGTSHMVERLNGKVKGKVFRAPSGVDEHLFSFSAEARKDLRAQWSVSEDSKVVLYVGKFGGIYYREEIAQFCKAMLEQDEKLFFVFLTPTDYQEVRLFMEYAELPQASYLITEGKSPAEVNRFISASDIGLTAIPPLPNQKYRSPVKVGEYLLGGLPYITCRGVSEDDRLAEQHRVGVVIEAMDPLEAYRIIPEMHKLLREDPESLRMRCRSAGLSYRNRRVVDELLDDLLAEA